tara:strand:+ start:558 stop:734 length:177 start_codon:yes stop_codon:yes gene_type:complete
MEKRHRNYHKINDSISVLYYHRNSEWVVYVKGATFFEYGSSHEVDSLNYALKLASKGK